MAHSYDKADIHAMRKEGYSVAKIAAHFDVTQSFVYSTLRFEPRASKRFLAGERIRDKKLTYHEAMPYMIEAEIEAPFMPTFWEFWANVYLDCEYEVNG